MDIIYQQEKNIVMSSNKSAIIMCSIIATTTSWFCMYIVYIGIGRSNLIPIYIAFGGTILIIVVLFTAIWYYDPPHLISNSKELKP